MLELEDVGFHGHHVPLLHAQNLAVAEGTLAEVRLPTAEARTALALICSGRLAPDEGDVRFEQEDGRSLRSSSALIDFPGITSAEHHMTVRDLIAETLGLIPRSRRNPPPSTAGWIDDHEISDVADEPVDALPAELRLWLMAELAFTDPHVRMAVLDSPDRHALSAEALAEVLSLISRPDDRTVLAVVSQEVLIAQEVLP